MRIFIIITYSVFFIGNSLKGQINPPNPIINASTYATYYMYDNAGNRIKRVILLNSSSLKSTQADSSEEALDHLPEDEKVIEEDLGSLNIKIYPNPTFGRLRVNLSVIDENFL